MQKVVMYRYSAKTKKVDIVQICRARVVSTKM